MAHIPHLFFSRPWDADTLTLTDGQLHHLRRVLRRNDPAPVSYTDGQGLVGSGKLEAGRIRRGDETLVPKPSRVLTVAVAPPRAFDRARFVVEKLAELGVDRLFWLTTDHGQPRAPRADKSARWAESALEQSRGAWLMAIEGPTVLAELPRPTWLVHPGGRALPPATGDVTLVIGPEGGFSEKELTEADMRVGLGARVLRVETAAVVASGLVLGHMGRMNT